MDFMPFRLNSSSLTCSICAMAVIIRQAVAMECQNLHMADSPIVSKELYKFGETGKPKLPDIKIVKASKLRVKVRYIFWDTRYMSSLHSAWSLNDWKRRGQKGRME